MRSAERIKAQIGREMLARDEPRRQQAERHQWQRDAREEPPHALELAALLMLELACKPASVACIRERLPRL